MMQEFDSPRSGDTAAGLPESGWRAWLDRSTQEESERPRGITSPVESDGGTRDSERTPGGIGLSLNRTEKGLVDLIGEQRWIDRLADPLAGLVSAVFRAAGPARGTLANLLHGVWLGHPLHAALVTVPVGAWTVTTVLDVVGLSRRDRGIDRAADLTLTVGLAGASVAALAGLADWHHTRGGTRRVGMIHATLNTVGALLNAGSLLARRTGNRPLGRTLSTTGYLGVLGSAWLGGELTYNQRIGVNQADEAPASPAFKPVLDASALGEGSLERVTFDGTPVLLSRRHGQVFAIGDTCSHLGCSLASGEIEGATVRCPCHGSRFALATGRVVEGPALYPVPEFEARIKGGQIEIRSR